MMEFVDIFTSDLATGVFIWASFAMLIVYAVAAIWILRSKRGQPTLAGRRSAFHASARTDWRLQSSNRS